MNTLTTIDDLYEQLLDHLYERQDAEQSRAIADQLDDLLSSADERDVGAIFAEECRSLISEARGDLPNAIRHREKEIHLISRVHEMSRNTDAQDFVHGQYDYEDLCDRLNILASLYHESGDLERAIETLEASKQFSLAHGLEFDWDDVLSAYRQEMTINVSYSLSASENGALSVRQIKTDIVENMPTATPSVLERRTTQVGSPARRIPLQHAEPDQSWRAPEAKVVGTNIIRSGI